MPYILNTDGLPEPPTAVSRRLREIHADLGLRSFPTGRAGEDGTPYKWGVTLRWAPDEPRRDGIKRGDFPPESDFDIECWLPPDSSPDEADSVFRNSMAQGSSERARKLVEFAERHNTAQTEEAFRPIMDEAFNVAEVQGAKLMGQIKGDGIAKVANAGIPGVTKGVPVKAKGGKPNGRKAR